MKDLKEMEKMEALAKYVSHVDGFVPRINAASDLVDLARFVLRALPVLRAAIAWSESFGELSKRLPPHVHELRRAVDEYEHAIAAFRKEGE